MFEIITLLSLEKKIYNVFIFILNRVITKLYKYFKIIK